MYKNSSTHCRERRWLKTSMQRRPARQPQRTRRARDTSTPRAARLARARGSASAAAPGAWRPWPGGRATWRSGCCPTTCALKPTVTPAGPGALSTVAARIPPCPAWAGTERTLPQLRTFAGTGAMHVSQAGRYARCCGSGGATRGRGGGGGSGARLAPQRARVRLVHDVDHHAVPDGPVRDHVREQLRAGRTSRSWPGEPRAHS